MSRRRAHAQDDSLELLLDTICNMFGGVIFMAILMAVLVQPAARAVDTAEVPVDPVLMDAVDRAERALRLAAAGAPEDAGPNSDAAQIIKELALARERLAKTKKQQEGVDLLLKNTSQRVDQLSKTARGLTLEIESLNRKIEYEKGSRISAARLPFEQKTVQTPIHLVISGDRVYEIYANDGTGGYITQTLDVNVLRDRPEAGDHLVTLKSDGGTPADSYSQSARWRSVRSRTNPQRHFFQLIVYPSGYASFQRVRQLLLSAQYGYDLALIAEGGEILLQPATEFRRQ